MNLLADKKEAPMQESIFQRYYRPEPFADRFARDPSGAIDVIIPVIHTNELWAKNLTSIYRDVPVNRMLISDGGCKDDSIAVVAKFPRVTVYDHRAYKTLGYCLRKLIESVETEWFIYLHSDVYLPEGWFDAMRRHQPEYDWFGCPTRFVRTPAVRWAGNRRSKRDWPASTTTSSIARKTSCWRSSSSAPGTGTAASKTRFTTTR
jgi:hypothetical protein